MSLERQVEIACPECGQEQTVIVWDSLNAQVSPEAREDLLAGKINHFACLSCEFQGAIPVPMLYHDMTRRFAVQFYPFDEVEDPDFLAQFDAQGRNRGMMDAVAECGVPDDDSGPSYLGFPHLVFSMAELVRYLIFRERLFGHDAEEERGSD